MSEFEQLWDMSIYQQQIDAEPHLVAEVLGLDS